VNDTGLPGVTLDDREHVCVFHRGQEERDTVLAAFFGAGLAAGDKCLCIADATDTEAVAARLDPDHRRTLPDQLTVLPATAYLTDGRFEPERVYSRWQAIIGGYVERDGYRHVRGTGELSWFLRHHRATGGDGTGALLEYEALCNVLVRRRPATIFCLYDLDLLDAGLLPGVLHHHSAVLAGGTLFRGWRVEERPGGANEALLLANQLLAGAKRPGEIDELLTGLRRAVLDADPAAGAHTGPEADAGPETERFLQALDGLAAPHRRAIELEAELANRPPAGSADAGSGDPGAAELARALLEGTAAGPAAAARARALGVDLDDPLRAVVVRPAPDGDRPPPEATRLTGATGVSAELAGLGVNLVAVGPGEIAFLAGDGDPVDAVVARLEAAGRFVGVGRAHTGAAGAARSYGEARQAADFAAALDRPVLRHKDLGLFSLLAGGGDPGPMAELVTEWLGPLLAHDRSRRPKLLPTLAAYLDAGAAQQATADALGIHVSTLKYRLGRIAAVTGRDLAQPDVRFQLQVALTAHRTLSVLQTQGRSSRTSRSADGDRPVA
jgi:hypothetical protein